MKFASIILAFAGLALAVPKLEARNCHADDCARQVTGTRPGLTPISSRLADCSRFQTVTVVPSAVTTTLTCYTSAEADPLAKRDLAFLAPRASSSSSPAATHMTVPEYASSCNAEGYATACSCWGFTATTYTAPRPTVTVTETVDYCE